MQAALPGSLLMKNEGRTGFLMYGAGEDYKNYGIEVKAGSNSGITAARLLQDGSWIIFII